MMLTVRRSLLGALALLAFTAGSANANRSIGYESPLIRATSAAVTYTGEEGLGITCGVTMAGSVHRSAAKTRGSLIGFINDVRKANCRGSEGTTGSAVILSLPSHITYESFEGTLPVIVGIRVTIIESWLLRVIHPVFGLLMECLYLGAIGYILTGREGLLERLRILPESRLVLVRAHEQTLLTCPAVISIAGEFNLAALIRITLL